MKPRNAQLVRICAGDSKCAASVVEQASSCNVIFKGGAGVIDFRLGRKPGPERGDNSVNGKSIAGIRPLRTVYEARRSCSPERREFDGAAVDIRRAARQQIGNGARRGPLGWRRAARRHFLPRWRQRKAVLFEKVLHTPVIISIRDFR